MALADLTAANAQLDANSDYEFVGSIEKCRLFIEAAMWILARRPTGFTADSGQGSDSATYSNTSLDRMLQDAQSWHRREAQASAAGGSGDVAFLSFENYR